MKIRNKWLAGVAIGAMLASGGAMAALNTSEVHLALTSLRLAMVKMGVANAMLSNPTPPSSNTEASVGAPNKMRTNDIKAIVVSKGGVINVYLTPVTGTNGGIIQLAPHIVTDKDGKKGVQYGCFSPNIPDIASAAPDCKYHPASK